MGQSPSSQKLGILQKTLGKLPITENDVEALATLFKVRAYAKKEWIFQQGGPVRDFFIVAEGTVEIFSRGLDEKEKLITIKTPGEMFGQSLGLLETEKPLRTSARCQSNVKVLQLQAAVWKKYLETARTETIAELRRDSLFTMQNLLSKIPFLKNLPGEKLDLVTKVVKYEFFSPGEVVVKEGDVGRKLYMVGKGRLKAYSEEGAAPIDNSQLGSRSPRRTSSLFREMSQGDYFGEIALMMNLPRTATVEAMEESALITLDHDQVEGLLLVVPELQVMFSKAVRERITKSLSKSHFPFFASMDDKSFDSLAAVCNVTTVQANSIIFKEGDPAYTFYVVVFGKLKVTDKAGKVLTTLEQGSYFGEIALVVDRPRTATVETVQHSVLITLTKREFELFFADHTDLYAEFCLKLLGAECPLKQILLHPQASKLYQEHLKSEFSDETIAFYQAVMKWKADAAQIMHTFVLDHAERPLNMSGALRKETKAAFERGDAMSLFDHSVDMVLSLMEDQFLRFQGSPAFTKFLEELGLYVVRDISMPATITTTPGGTGSVVMTIFSGTGGHLFRNGIFRCRYVTHDLDDDIFTD
eukprot:g62295.t1